MMTMDKAAAFYGQNFVGAVELSGLSDEAYMMKRRP